MIYAFTGFFAPVDNLPTLNMVKGGSSLPIKFSLSGNRVLAIIAAGNLASRPIACDTELPTAPVEETATPGSSGLSYDAATDQYPYVWKAQKSWKNTCREFSIQLTDGPVHLAIFKFS